MNIEELSRISETTIAHYDRSARAYCDGTRDHDVSQNYAALLDAIEGDPPHSILDLGCGPGRDLQYFRSLWDTKPWAWTDRRSSWLWRTPIRVVRFSTRTFSGWNYRRAGSTACLRTRRCSTCRVRSCRGVLDEIAETLRPRGVLFCSNPRGHNEEGWSGDRYSCFFDLNTWRNYLCDAGFVELNHYYRPPGLPHHKQPWLATVSRRASAAIVS